MHPVEIEKRNTIAPLFEGIQDSMVIACLQGIMGQAYVARETEPKAALIVSGEYSFFGGGPTSPDARELVQNLFPVNESDRTVVIFNDQLLQRYMDAIPEGYLRRPSMKTSITKPWPRIGPGNSARFSHPPRNT